MKLKNRVLRIVLIVFVGVIAIYLLTSIYFLKNFYIGTKIEGVKATGKSVEEINKILLSKVNEYELEIIGRDDKDEELLASEINLKYDFIGDIEKIKQEQNPFLWIISLFVAEEYSLDSVCTYNDEQLKETIAGLDYFNQENVLQPQNATLIFNNGKYEISKEVNGNKVNVDKLYNSAKDAILNFEKTIDIEDENCYEKPIYTSESKEIIQARDLLNKYVSTKINYQIGEKSEVVDGALINEWLKLDDKFNVSIDEKNVNSYIESLGDKYDYSNQNTDYNMSNGQIVNVTYSSDSAYIDKETEVKALIQAIAEGKEINRNIELKKENSNNTTNTFVEINLTEQKIWFYKDGELITSGSVVTGNVSKSMDTPPGIFTLNNKERYAVLRGVDYAVPVDYWMPFNGGIGIHDAKWRSTFGGDYYKTEGSHGCINTPYDVVQAIYENITVGTYVVCHY